MAIKEYRLGDICKIQRGSSPRPIHNYETKKVTKYPWAKISDLKENEIFKTENYLTNIDDFKWKKYMICEPGDLLLTCCATPGIPFINLVKNCGYHDGFLKITPNENSIIKKYLIYKLIKDRNKLIKNGNGTIFINLNKSIVENFKILTPSIDEQQEIINIIEPFENLLNLFNKELELYNNFLMLLFYKMKTNNSTTFFKFFTLKNCKYNNQTKYVDTSNISKSIFKGFEPVIKLKSRANLSPEKESIIFSKLKGENKIFPIYNEHYLEYVYSTGFINIKSKYNSYIYGYMLTDDFHV